MIHFNSLPMSCAAPVAELWDAPIAKFLVELYLIAGLSVIAHTRRGWELSVSGAGIHSPFPDCRVSAYFSWGPGISVQCWKDRIIFLTILQVPALHLIILNI